MKILVGAAAGALTVGALLVSYSLGDRHAFAQETISSSLPMMQSAIGPDGIARPYFVQAGQAVDGRTLYAPAVYAPSSYSSPSSPNSAPYVRPASRTVADPYERTAPPAEYPNDRGINERVAVAQPAVQRVGAPRVYNTEGVAKPKRTWQKRVLLIGGSAGAGAGLGAIIGGKKGAAIGAAIGGGSAAIYDQAKGR